MFLSNANNYMVSNVLRTSIDIIKKYVFTPKKARSRQTIFANGLKDGVQSQVEPYQRL